MLVTHHYLLKIVLSNVLLCIYVLCVIINPILFHVNDISCIKALYYSVAIEIDDGKWNTLVY